MTSVSAGHIILTPTQTVGSGRPQRGSNPGPPRQESRALPTELPRPPLHYVFALDTAICTRQEQIERQQENSLSYPISQKPDVKKDQHDSLSIQHLEKKPQRKERLDLTKITLLSNCYSQDDHDMAFVSEHSNDTRTSFYIIYMEEPAQTVLG